MAHWNIVDVFSKHGQLVFQVDHFHTDGAFWFMEHYTWSGRSWFTKRVQVNSNGDMLLTNGEVAPSRPVDPGDPPSQYLPDGEEWARLADPSLTVEDVTSLITSDHNRRLDPAFPEFPLRDILGTFKPNQSDEDGCESIADYFASLKGTEG